MVDGAIEGATEVVFLDFFLVAVPDETDLALLVPDFLVAISVSSFSLGSVPKYPVLAPSSSSPPISCILPFPFFFLA